MRFNSLGTVKERIKVNISHYNLNFLFKRSIDMNASLDYCPLEKEADVFYK
jgi:hypothetical protein